MSEIPAHLRVRRSGNRPENGEAQMNGLLLSMAPSGNPYDVSGGWLAEMNRACDKFLWSRGIDPATGQRPPWLSSVKIPAKKSLLDA